MAVTVESSVIQYLMIPSVREVCIGFFQDWMFNSDVCKYTYEALRKNPNYAGQIPLASDLILELHNTYKVDEMECATIAVTVDMANDLKSQLTSGGLENMVNQIQGFIKDRLIARGVENIAVATRPADKEKGSRNLQEALNFTITTDTFADLSDDGTVMTAKEDDFPPGGAIIKSYFKIVNRSSLYKGYKYGDLAMISAKPAGGKSSAMICEGGNAIDQGFRVCHVFLGDMSVYDALIKYIAFWTDVPQDEILADGYEKYMTPSIKAKFKLLRVKSFPADTFDVYQLMSKVNQLRNAFKFDLWLVDYDANIKSSFDGGNMYGEGGNTYANLKSYGSKRCATIIGSQIKPEFWNTEVVPMNSSAESSKKPHHVDMQLNIGINPACPDVGTLNLAKMRRGKSNVQSRLYLDYATRIKEVSYDTYNRLLIEHKERQAKLAASVADEESQG